ncbi:inositol monophosphatase family protein [Halomonas caseinilytica]|uniref:inositol monophosphatase family protein n=1 Tax=Halomonas caseinilytica TaxID=438744 RepID=UPI0007E5474C|nr:inositol monophosphatase family protein [Halomonas caseinilytica]SEN01315.1 myo-inositol-1(or 4)-monophosphatase [Halomonas caseinilytica]
MHESSLIASLQHAARLAGAHLLEGYQAAGAIDFEAKGASDFVTHYDRAAERIIIDCLQRAHPGLAFLGEESGVTPSGAGDTTVIIDPLDGTNNFLHRVPHFSVSIAVRQGRSLTHGVVYQPLLDEMLWAVAGEGAYRNEQRIAAPPARALHEMLIATCLPYHDKGDCPTSLAQLTALMPRVAGIRVPGSAALEVAYAGLGRFDAFWSQGARLELWDVAAGIVIAREAGCTVTDIAGDSTPDEWASLLVAHPERHGELLEILSAGGLSRICAASP